MGWMISVTAILTLKEYKKNSPSNSMKNRATNTSTPSPANYTRVNGHE